MWLNEIAKRAAEADRKTGEGSGLGRKKVCNATGVFSPRLNTSQHPQESDFVPDVIRFAFEHLLAGLPAAGCMPQWFLFDAACPAAFLLLEDPSRGFRRYSKP